MEKASTKSRVARPSRQSVGARDRLQIINKDPNREYRLANVDPSRIFELENLGYRIEKVTDFIPKGLRVDSVTLPDNALPVGGGQRQVLMSCTKEDYEDGKRENEERVRATEAATKPNSDGQYGKVQISTAKSIAE